MPFACLVVALRRTFSSGGVATRARGALLYVGFFVMLVLWMNILTRYTIRNT